MAIITAREDGIQALLGASLNSLNSTDIEPYMSTVQRGLYEIEEFFKKAGVR